MEVAWDLASKDWIIQIESNRIRELKKKFWIFVYWKRSFFASLSGFFEFGHSKCFFVRHPGLQVKPESNKHFGWHRNRWKKNMLVQLANFVDMNFCCSTTKCRATDFLLIESFVHQKIRTTNSMVIMLRLGEAFRILTSHSVSHRLWANAWIQWTVANSNAPFFRSIKPCFQWDKVFYLINSIYRVRQSPFSWSSVHATVFEIPSKWRWTVLPNQSLALNSKI